MQIRSLKLERKERKNLKYRVFKIDNILFPIKDFLDNKSNQLDLEKLKLNINKLKEICPMDPDLQVFHAIVNSIDNKHDRSEQITQVLKNLLNLKDSLQLSNKEKILSTDKNKITTSVKKSLDRLEASGISDQHEIVLSGIQDAPCIILFLQTHSNSREFNEERILLDSFSGANISQNIISDALKNGVADTIFLEGFPFGKINFSKEKINNCKKTPEWNRFFKSEQTSLELSIDNKIKIRGAELLNDKTRISPLFVKYRNSSCNILLASTIALGMDVTNSSSQAAITMGAAHEKNILGVDPEIKLSEILAHYGIDVIIVDTSSKFMNKRALSILALKKCLAQNSD